MTGPEDGGVPRTFRKVPEGGPERDALRAEARVLLDQGSPQRVVAEILGVSRGSLRRLVELPGGTVAARVNDYEHGPAAVEAKPAVVESKPSVIEAPTNGTAADLIAYELALATKALAAGERDKALALIERARFRGATREQVAAVLDLDRPRPDAAAPKGAPARVKAERVAVELPGLGRVDRRLVVGAVAALGLVVVVAALVWQARGESWQGPIEPGEVVE
jgi:hypothetical protein